MLANCNSRLSGGKKGLIGKVCQFLWWKYSHHSRFHVTDVMCQNVGLARGAQLAPVSGYELAPEQRCAVSLGVGTAQRPGCSLTLCERSSPESV